MKFKYEKQYFFAMDFACFSSTLVLRILFHVHLGKKKQLCKFTNTWNATSKQFSNPAKIRHCVFATSLTLLVKTMIPCLIQSALFSHINHPMKCKHMRTAETKHHTWIHAWSIKGTPAISEGSQMTDTVSWTWLICCCMSLMLRTKVCIMVL